MLGVSFLAPLGSFSFSCSDGTIIVWKKTRARCCCWSQSNPIPNAGYCTTNDTPGGVRCQQRQTPRTSRVSWCVPVIYRVAGWLPTIAVGERPVVGRHMEHQTGHRRPAGGYDTTRHDTPSNWHPSRLCLTLLALRVCQGKYRVRVVRRPYITRVGHFHSYPTCRRPPTNPQLTWHSLLFRCHDTPLFSIIDR